MDYPHRREITLWVARRWHESLAALAIMALAAAPSGWAQEAPAAAAAANAAGLTEDQMQPYTEQISGTMVKFEMVPIHGGTFLMGSPEGEEGRKEDEGPQRRVKIEPFWMGRCEVTWDEYDIWTFSLDIQRRGITGEAPTRLDLVADAVTRPTKPYTDMTFGMGKEGFPAICMTQLAAKTYCKWLSAKTGRYYRLPTEAEWEYACRAGTTTPYYFGDDTEQIGDHAWHYDNSEDAYHPVGAKKANPWGLKDMHGNVAEWCLDQHTTDHYAKLPADSEVAALEALCVPTKEEPCVVRGGSWDDDPEALRSAARRGSEKSWKQQDPQIPQSKWYYTDALFVGFRVVRPLKEPTPDEDRRYWGEVKEAP